MKKDYWTTNFRASHDYYRPPMYGIARSIRAGIDDLALIYVEKREISTPITATYQRLSSANVRISYGNHSRPCVIRILRRKDDGI